MSSDKGLLGLHALRVLGAVLEDRHHVGLFVLGSAGPPQPIRNDTEGPQRALARILAESPELSRTFEAAVRDAPLGRPVRLPPGIAAFVGALQLPTGPGRLIIAPFVGTERERRALAEALSSATNRRRDADRLAKTAPVLDAAAEALVKTALRVAADESALYVAAVERSLKNEAGASGAYGRLIGKSPAMRTLFGQLDRIASSDGTVYIHGENGTGKELVASELHVHSRRAERAFVVQNCSALNDNLLESELFGHRRGAFTGAVADKPGLFELADTGTFFLDEVGDMSPALQAKVLRVIQEGTFSRVGDTAVRRVDVRILCATNRDLEQLVARGAFRQDLFYRLNVLTVRVPPLRARKGDVAVLAAAFLERAQREQGQPGGRKRFTPEALRQLEGHDWPGNVRELENEVERLVVLAGPFVSRLGPELLSAAVRHKAVTDDEASFDDVSLPMAVERLERRLIERALVTHHGNKSHAAKALGVSRRNLIRRCQEIERDAAPG